VRCAVLAATILHDWRVHGITALDSRFENPPTMKGQRIRKALEPNEH